MGLPEPRCAYGTKPSEDRPAQRLLNAARTALAHGDQLEASDLFRKAGNLFKLERQWQAAGTALQEAARLKAPLQTDDRSDQYPTPDNRRAALTCLQAAADLLTEAGDFYAAAGHIASMGQLLLTHDIDRGRGVWGHRYANKAWLTAGELAALKGDYGRAIAVFEMVARAHHREPAERDDEIFTADYFQTDRFPDALQANPACFRAVLCYLCRDGQFAAKMALAMDYGLNQFTAKSVEGFRKASDEKAAYGTGSTYNYGTYNNYYYSNDYYRLDQWSRKITGSRTAGAARRRIRTSALNADIGPRAFPSMLSN
ncbi:beta-soluble NSF attachment protein-like [Paramacrobiotus metropolitanus]|uniref:beta-soluble NSF attachment protein-like n=1 Tax=Paramacrobiotus metropolitanus TaxID=2943436 RepID=UPI002445E278|nr:beta-soluble NSF attachment protein-like [Paramacrobiotus metropolitanus]